MTTRRTFMRQVGVSLAMLLLSGCDPKSKLTAPPPRNSPTPEPRPTCYVPPVEPLEPVPAETLAAATEQARSSRQWQWLRDCWLALKDPRLQLAEDEGYSALLLARHATALNLLVSGKELTASVADQIRVAFSEAVSHIRQQTACCYEAIPPEFAPRQDLTIQAAALTEMAAGSAIDPATVARARAALERDMAWLAQFEAGKDPGDLDAIQASPTEIEAARVLVELLLGNE